MGALQDQVIVLGQQASALDSQYRRLQTERRQYKIDAEVGSCMSDMQARQMIILRWGGWGRWSVSGSHLPPLRGAPSGAPQPRAMPPLVKELRSALDLVTDPFSSKQCRAGRARARRSWSGVWVVVYVGHAGAANDYAQVGRLGQPVGAVWEGGVQQGVIIG
jgi:hypothetical protein